MNDEKYAEILKSLGIQFLEMMNLNNKLLEENLKLMKENSELRKLLQERK